VADAFNSTHKVGVRRQNNRDATGLACRMARTTA
jgi:hypothetical protein